MQRRFIVRSVAGFSAGFAPYQEAFEESGSTCAQMTRKQDEELQLSLMSKVL
jgi:hypothetical protein